MSYSSYENGTAQDSFVITGKLLVQSEPGQASTSTVTFDGGGFTSDGAGNITTGFIAPNNIYERSTGAAQVIATGGTIAVTNGNVVVGTARCAPAAAVTGVIMPAGVKDGQQLTVINESASANSITFAASGTSNVADGTSDVIAGVTARRFVWDAGTSLWYRVG